ncbi:MAG TPA: TIGR02300 family protein [Geminicoccus sp.]|uniref:TIGR02300 family protein n=1 Tax=Geminicoccus sp. TaxID=2024832 RepID=UPI002C2CECF2|nr:TIGR02300 family protein [Geminicoccus sp.]HWL69978.1 TIGR02300 family protein [Geminicoccus sp.]
MAKPEWGAKRICLNCGARFYDLNNSPIVCPSCGTPYDVEVASRVRKARPARAAVVEDEDLVTAKGAAATEDEDAEVLDEVGDDEALVEAEDDDVEDVPADTDEDEEDDALIEDVEELGDEDDMSDVIEGGRDEDEESR